MGDRILFTYGSRFSLNTDSRHTFIWREPGTRCLPSNIREIDNHGGGSLMIWAGIILDGRTPLHVFKRGSVTGVRGMIISSMGMSNHHRTWDRKTCLVGENRDNSNRRKEDEPSEGSVQTNAGFLSTLVVLKKPARIQIYHFAMDGLSHPSVYESWDLKSARI
ncbi:transposable element Tc1 transposase [Trichonephila clavipes]|nr:transposable element Tc1 transposase [Trichonephila clavipes]